MFCPKCGSIMLPKKGIWQCSCGHKDKGKESLKLKDESKKEAKKDIMFGVADADREVLPLTDADCPKCDHNKAYFWTMQTRAADEAETRFYKCEKCKHVWREYK